RRMSEDVHAHAAVQIGADRAQLDADGLADALLEIEVPRRPPRHADRVARRSVDDDATGAVAEREPWQAETLDTGRVEGALVVAAAAHVAEAGPERRVAVEAPQLLVLGHVRDERAGGLSSVVRHGAHRFRVDVVRKQAWKTPRSCSSSTTSSTKSTPCAA